MKEGARKLLVLPMNIFLFKDITISVIGAGNLGTAVVNALIKKGHQKIIATRRNEQSLEELKNKYGIEVSKDNNYAVEKSNIVILGVKPCLIDGVCQEIRASASGKLVISLAAAKKLEDLESNLYDSRVCRVMTGISVEAELATYAFSSKNTPEDEVAVKYIFGQSAKNVIENSLADRTWIACDAGLLAKGLEHKITALDGLTRDDARIIYAATLEGIAKLLRDGMTGDDIYNLVAAKGSFTEKLNGFLTKNRAYSLMKDCAKYTIDACK